MEPLKEGPRSEDIARIGDLTGRCPTGFRRAAGGYTPAERWVVELEGGDRAFAKIGVDETTAAWLRDEHRAYAAIAGDFMPRLRGWDDGERPLLLLEDLSGCFWPPPWDDRRVVLEALARLRAVDPAGALPPVGGIERELSGGWRRVSEEPAPFLSLGLATERWLRDNAPALAEASEGAALDGSFPAHLDVRSDNLCFRDGRAVLVDWNHAVVAHPDLDIAGWAPRVREVQRKQLRTALPWAVRALGLPSLDGPAATESVSSPVLAKGG